MALKIAYIAKVEVENMEYWSGIPYNIYHFLKKNNFEVTLIDKFPKLPLKILKLYEVFWRFFNIKYENRNKKWFQLIFRGKEWQPILQSMDLLNQIEQYQEQTNKTPTTNSGLA